MTDSLKALKEKCPGRKSFIDTIATLSSAGSRSPVYIHDPSTFRQTRTLLSDLFDIVSQKSARTRYALADCASCFTPRLLFTTILNALADFEPSWLDGYKTWSYEDDAPIDGFDAFLHGLQSILQGVEQSSSKTGQMAIIVLVNPERMKYPQQNLIAPMSRLQELTNCNILTVFLSTLQWESIYPAPGFLPEPFIVNVAAANKDDMVEILYSTYPHSHDQPPPYSPTLAPLYRHFVEALVDICIPFTDDPLELAYVAAAQWPAFVSPVVEEWKNQHGGTAISSPTEEQRVRLIRLFSASFTQAVEKLYPRLVGATEWCERSKPPEGLRVSQLFNISSIPFRSDAFGAEATSEQALPRLAQFVLVASFIASHNPAKTDLRMLGHTQDRDGKSPRKRKQGGARQTRTGAAAKVSQHLLGPTAFSLDRLLAILGVLLAEYDEDARRTKHSFGSGSGCETEVEISQFLTLSSIQELVSMKLLVRTTPPERPDASSMHKCIISYERALSLSRKLVIPLSELLWEAA